jgi:Flp pilus assembly protein TadD
VNQGQGAQAARRDSGIRRGFAAAVGILTALVFARCVRGGFVNLDDRINVVDNLHFRGFAASNLFWMFGLGSSEHYIPLTWLSFAVDFKLWGLNPAGYHLTNVLLHALGASVFFLVMLRLLRAGGPGAPENGRRATAAAAFAALLFSMHPLRVESVAWVTERRDVLSGLFWLLALWCYLRRADPEARGGKAWLRLSAAAYACSLLSKSIGMTFPVALLIVDVYSLRRRLDAAAVWLEKIPFFVMAAAAGALALNGQRHFSHRAGFAFSELGARAAVSCFAPVFYLWKTVVPAGLSPLYELPAHIQFSQPRFALCAVLIAVVTGAAFAVRKSRPAVPACWLFYLVTLSPVCGILQFGDQIAADRYTYLPSLAGSVLAGSAVYVFMKRLDAGRARLLLGGCAAWLAILGILTWRQAGVWRDSGTLWRQALEVDPNSSHAHAGLARFLSEPPLSAPAAAESAAHFNEALRLNPDDYQAHLDFGDLLFKTERTADAIREYQEALRLNTKYARAADHLGLALFKLGRFQEGLQAHAAAASFDPASPAYRVDLADALNRTGNVKEAAAQYQEALRLGADTAQMRNNWGIALARLGEREQARRQFEKALELQPGFPDALRDLDMLSR